MVIIREITDEEFYAFPGPLAIIPFVANPTIDHHHDQRPPLQTEWINGTTIGLPPGWIMEKRPRTTEKYWGKIDQFYYEPGTRKQFRSIKAVQNYLAKKIQEETAPQPSHLHENEAEVRPRKRGRPNAISEGFLNVGQVVASYPAER